MQNSRLNAHAKAGVSGGFDRSNINNSNNNNNINNNSRVSLSLSDLHISPSISAGTSSAAANNGMNQQPHQSPYPNKTFRGVPNIHATVAAEAPTAAGSIDRNFDRNLDIHIGGTVGDISPDKLNYRKELGKLLKKSRGTAYESTLRRFVEQKYREMKADEEEHQSRLRTMRFASPVSAGLDALHYRDSRFDSSSPSRRQFTLMESHFSVSEGDTLTQRQMQKPTGEERRARLEKMAAPRESHKYKGPLSEQQPRRFPSPTNSAGRQRPGPPLAYPQSPPLRLSLSQSRSPSSLMGSSIPAPLSTQQQHSSNNNNNHSRSNSRARNRSNENRSSSRSNIHSSNNNSNDYTGVGGASLAAAAASSSNRIQLQNTRVASDFTRKYYDYSISLPTSSTATVVAAASMGRGRRGASSNNNSSTSNSSNRASSLTATTAQRSSQQQQQRRARTPSPAPSSSFKSWLETNQEWEKSKQLKLQQRAAELQDAARKLPSTPKVSRKSIKLAEIAEQREQYRMRIQAQFFGDVNRDVDSFAAASNAVAATGEEPAMDDTSVAAIRSVASSSGTSRRSRSSGRLAITTDEETASATSAAASDWDHTESAAAAVQLPTSADVYDRLAQRSRHYAQKFRSWEPPQQLPQQFYGSPQISDFSRRLAQRRREKEAATSAERPHLSSSAVGRGGDNYSGYDGNLSSSNTSINAAVDVFSRATTPTSRRARSASPYTAHSARSNSSSNGLTAAGDSSCDKSSSSGVKQQPRERLLQGSGLSQLRARAAQKLAEKQQLRMNELKQQLQQQRESKQRKSIAEIEEAASHDFSREDQRQQIQQQRGDSLSSAGTAVTTGTADVDFFELYGARSRRGSAISVHENALCNSSKALGVSGSNSGDSTSAALRLDDLSVAASASVKAAELDDQENIRQSPNITGATAATTTATTAAASLELELEERLLLDDSVALRELTRESLRRSREQSRERKKKELAQFNWQQYGTERLHSPPRPFQPMIGSETQRIMSRVKSSFSERNTRLQEILLVRKELAKRAPLPGPGHYNKLDQRTVRTPSRSPSPGNRGFSFGREPSGRLDEARNNNMNGTFSLTATGNFSNFTGSRLSSPNRRSKLL